MQSLFSIIILPFLLSILSGCAEMNSKFDCPMKSGVSCASLDKVNEKIDRGEIGFSEKELADRHSIQNASFNQMSFTPQACGEKCGNPRPLREGESVQHIWVAPFEDKSGNYHQESDIYTVVKQGHWVGHPMKEIHNDEG